MTDPIASNLFAVPETRPGGELFDDILVRPGCRVERIVSFGQVTPPETPYVQDWDEWVLVLQGAATVRLDDREVALQPGDGLLIPARLPHWVVFTDTAAPTIWLAIHFGETPPSQPAGFPL